MPGLDVVDELAALADGLEPGRIPVLAPRRFLDEVDARSPDPLPPSWDVTSDTIAARLAVRLGAAELVLLKSTPLAARHRPPRGGRSAWSIPLPRRGPRPGTCRLPQTFAAFEGAQCLSGLIKESWPRLTSQLAQRTAPDLPLREVRGGSGGGFRR